MEACRADTRHLFFSDVAREPDRYLLQIKIWDLQEKHRTGGPLFRMIKHLTSFTAAVIRPFKRYIVVTGEGVPFSCSLQWTPLH